MREHDRLLELRERLLAWFRAGARDLPWRRTRDPYAIMVSEIMLQQTQVDRVIPKYEAFLAQFPDVAALADAPTADVIRAWAGLGYNRRAVNLQRAARIVVGEHGGRFPQEVAALRRLPGIGPYTAGAIACFAFEQDVAFFDTNIRRVIARLFFPPDHELPGDAQTQALAESLLPHGEAWAWNQGIMELGALICTAAAPACWRCTVSGVCRDYQARLQHDADPFAAPPAVPRRRVAERRDAPFAGSSRFYRGRIVDALRGSSPAAPLALADLGPLVKPDYASSDEEWLRRLVAGLARDGLVLIDGDTLRLPE